MNAQQAMQRAAQAKTVLPAFNIPYLPMMEPVVQAVRDEDAAAMIQVARLEWEKFSSQSLEAVAAEYEKRAVGNTFLHLDHVPVIDEDRREVDYLPIILRAIQAGYQSVMIDGSRLPLEENIAATAKVTELAHRSHVAVEAELGAVAGHEAGGVGMDYETLFATKKGFTDPAQARVFAAQSGCDWLSVAVGSVHGAIADGLRRQKKPEARLDIGQIAALYEATGHMPLVLHGGSGIRREYILQAMRSGISKINVATEIRQPYEAAMEERPGDVLFAQQQVYERTRWVLREFLGVSGSAHIIFDETARTAER